MVRSDVTTYWPGPNETSSAPANGASATSAAVPAKNTPAPDCSHGLAGMPNVTAAGLALNGVSPSRWWIGGAALSPWTAARIRSRPVMPSIAGTAYAPRTGSSLVHATGRTYWAAARRPSVAATWSTYAARGSRGSYPVVCATLRSR